MRTGMMIGVLLLTSTSGHGAQGMNDGGVTSSDTPMRLCLQTRKVGYSNGLGNFLFSGRIWGDDPASHAGYWVVARDETGASWAQAGAGVRGDDGNIRFGVSNISAYPLEFFVLRMATNDEYESMRIEARKQEPLGTALVLRTTLPVSPSGMCTFDLDGTPENGTPVDRNGTCACS